MMSKTINEYQKELARFDRKPRNLKDYTSMLILAIVEEVGEMARAYLTQTGRKPSNIRAQKDETYKQELGDIIVAIMKLANIKKIDLDEQISYSLSKVKRKKRL